MSVTAVNTRRVKERLLPQRAIILLQKFTLKIGINDCTHALFPFPLYQPILGRDSACRFYIHV